MVDITVVIGTYGADAWFDLAQTRAVPSVEQQGVPVVHVHGETLAQARNEGLLAVREEWGTEWAVVLDADDELAPGFVDAMVAARLRYRNLRALYTPAIEYVRGRKRYRPRFQPQVRIEDGNWLVIGTMIPVRETLAVGGFEEWPLYEDWALFARLQKTGLPVRKVHGAVYVAHYTPGSRNHPSGGRRAKLAAHDMIRRAVFPELYEEAT